MKWNQLLRKEFTEIIKSKKILIPIIAVLFVPILYAGMFLWAFWDPYKQLDDLPVAVVNLDKGAVFDGKPIEVGKGLVDNLKDNTSFKWEFVSEKEAKKGMEGRKYYMLVRIPDNFSSNATTLLKDDPKPLNLEYIPNESLNFLSSQIGGTAIEKIKGEVSSTLTKTYAEKMFDSIQDVSKGLADGAEGANKLHDGSSELHDGSSKVTDGLHTLQGKSGEMKDGVGKLFDGSGKVTAGLNTLNSKTGEMQIGVGKLVDGSGKVTDGLHVLNSNAGIGKLVDGSGKVTNGLNMLNSKTGEMQIGIGKLVDGSGKVTNGLNTLNSKTSEMQTGIGKLVDGSGKVTNGLNTLNSKTGELRDGSEKVTGGLNKLVSKSGELQTGTTDLSNGMGKLVEGKSQLEEGSQAIQKGLQDLNSNVQKSAAGLEEMQSKVPSILNTVNEKIDGAGANVNQLHELTQSTAGDAKTAAQDVANLQKQIESLPKEYQEQLQPFITSAVKSTATVQQKAAGVAGGTNKLNEEVKQLKGEIHQTTNGLQNQLPNPAGVKNLAGGIAKLTSAQNEFVSKFHGFGEGLDNAKIGADKLKDGSVQLIDGVTQLQSGSGKVTAGLGQLSGGVNQLADGSSQVTGGLGTLSAGANQMAGGVNQLADGSSQVTGGLGTLSAGANQMAGGVNQLADGSSQVTGGLGTLSVGVTKLADGSNQVTGGLGTLSAGAGQMTGGITQLANGSDQVTTGLSTLSTGSTQLIDGVNKLADGSGKVTDGLVKVNDGSGELAEKLGEGAEKTGEVKGTDKTYDMFASPVKVKTEKMAEVPNYGTGFTPYFLSLGLFVGALLLSIVYPLRDTVGVPKSGFSWFISKFGVLLSVGIIQAVVADVILLFGLGVEVQSIPYFILFSIVTSLAFIALIQCLVTAFGDAGRFIAIITLIIQLTTSAGTFPLELIPKLLQPFNAWLPMTYSVSGLKAVVSSGDFNFMWQNVGVLMIFIVVLSLGTIASLTWMHKRQFRNIAENQSIEA
ncbi:YhgE/Pip domain-containing protein [Bacillus mobilis]|uniref:YhgE/Pip domain-containing protein n=1 Tax=Bacillus mobilis TaxID=2026190 RepID=UPI0013D08E59|nr:YhgE/Pip domain-containing protein [Bacillus mobilis]NEK97878.1 YhgE/Pip domain-containing protein [Bacillus mobilis]